MPIVSQGMFLACVDPYNEYGVRECESNSNGRRITQLSADVEVDPSSAHLASQVLSCLGTGTFLWGGVVAAINCAKKGLTGALLFIGILGGTIYLFYMCVHVRVCRPAFS